MRKRQKHPPGIPEVVHVSHEDSEDCITPQKLFQEERRSTRTAAKAANEKIATLAQKEQKKMQKQGSEEEAWCVRKKLGL